MIDSDLVRGHVELIQTRWNTMRLALILLITLNCIVPSVPRAATVPVSANAWQDSLWTKAESDSLARIEQLWRTKNGTGVESCARSLLAEVEATHGRESLQAALVLDRLLRSFDFLYAAPEAREFAERAVQIKEKLLGPEHVAVAVSLTNLAQVLSVRGEIEQARGLDERALAIREKKLGPDHPRVAESLGNLSMLLEMRGDFAGARPLEERRLAILDKSQEPDSSSLAIALSSLAFLRETAGDHAGAIQLYERKLAIEEEKWGPNSEGVAGTHEMLGYLLRTSGNLVAAQWHYEQALGMWEREQSDRNEFMLAQNLEALAELACLQGKNREALNLALRAEASGHKYFLAQAHRSTDEENLAFGGIPRSGLHAALSLLDSLADVQDKRTILDVLVRCRTLALDELAARHRVPGQGDDPAIDSLAARRLATASRYSNLMVRREGAEHPERYRQVLGQAMVEMRAAERELSDKSATYQREHRAREVRLADVMSVLPPGSALMGFASYQRFVPGRDSNGVTSYLAYLVRGGSDGLAVVQLGSAQGLDSLIARWREESGRGPLLRGRARSESAYQRVGRALRRRLWDPLVPNLQGIDRLFVVPDGAVNLVNLSTLPLDDGHYLVETGPLVHYLSAERDLVSLDSLRTQGEGMLAIGGPSFDERPGIAWGSRPTRPTEPGLAAEAASPYRGQLSSCGDFAAVRFGALPGTLREVQELRQVWSDHEAKGASPSGAGAPLSSGAVQVLTGAKADERTFKQLAPGRAVLHLATHGFFVTGHCESAMEQGKRGIGGLSTAPGPGAHAATGENPLVLSGLALAGANQRAHTSEGEEDGILTAEEIASLDLSGCDWAVLSACDTGVGEIKAGEGVLGLRRAFAIAGARTLIMSLWSVDDQSTRQWMRALYTAHFARGLPTAESVRTASLEVLRSRRAKGESTHPFYWGAFVAAGDWR